MFAALSPVFAALLSAAAPTVRVDAASRVSCAGVATAPSAATCYRADDRHALVLAIDAGKHSRLRYIRFGVFNLAHPATALLSGDTYNRAGLREWTTPLRLALPVMLDERPKKGDPTRPRPTDPLAPGTYRVSTLAGDSAANAVAGELFLVVPAAKTTPGND